MVVSDEVIDRMLKGSKKARYVALLWLESTVEQREEIEKLFADVFEDYKGEPHSI